MEVGRKCFSVAAICSCLLAVLASAQKMPDVRCQVEDFPIDVLVSWQFQETLDKVQVVVLRDPAGEQEARFDLTHGATLVSLRYRGKELLYAHGAGTCVATSGDELHCRPWRRQGPAAVQPGPVRGEHGRPRHRRRGGVPRATVHARVCDDD